MDPGLVSGLGLRVRRFQGKEGSFQGKGGKKLPREERKEALREGRKEASEGREKGSFLGKGGRKLPREGKKKLPMHNGEGSHDPGSQNYH